MSKSIFGIKNGTFENSEIMLCFQSDPLLCRIVEAMLVNCGSFFKEMKVDDNFFSIPEKFSAYKKHLSNHPESEKALSSIMKYMLQDDFWSNFNPVRDRVMYAENTPEEINDLLYHINEISNLVNYDNFKLGDIVDTNNFLNKEDFNYEKAIRDLSFFNVINSAYNMSSEISQFFVANFTKNSTLLLDMAGEMSYKEIENLITENIELMNTLKHIGQIVMTSECLIDIDANYCVSNIKKNVDQVFETFFENDEESSLKMCFSGFDEDTKKIKVLFYTPTNSLKEQAVETIESLCDQIKNRIAFTDKNLNDVIKSVEFNQIRATLGDRQWGYLFAPNKEAKKMLKNNEKMRVNMRSAVKWEDGPSI